MLKFTPILLAILYALAMYRFSVWRTKRELDARSTELADPLLKVLTTAWRRRSIWSASASTSTRSTR
jgi:hypothetical protein